MKALRVVILTLAGLLCGCHAPNDNRIIPGERVGKIVIGHTKASEVGPGDGSISDEYNNQGFGFGFDQQLKVDSIDVTRSNFRTREGLSAGSTEQEVVAAYGLGTSSPYRSWMAKSRRAYFPITPDTIVEFVGSLTRIIVFG